LFKSLTNHDELSIKQKIIFHQSIFSLLSLTKKGQIKLICGYHEHMNTPLIHKTLLRLADSLPKGARLLGLDVGSKTIGLAVSNSDLTVATAIDTIRRIKFAKDFEQLKNIIEGRSIGGLVIGLPISMDGTEGPACQSIRQFSTNIVERMDINITFWDERLSTSAVQRFLTDEADMTRKRRGEVVDKLAATYILQGAINSLWELRNNT
jgi:putative Holliday junction resolvase